MVVDWTAVFLGVAVGVPVSALFFAGLAWGMARALDARHSGGLLLLSAAIRMAMLLGVGLWLAASSATAWPMAGYALAFVLVRMIAILWAKKGKSTAVQPPERV